MMIEVRDILGEKLWEPIDFYTSGLADIPLSAGLGARKKFTSLFKHSSSLLVESKVKFIISNLLKFFYCF